jgi:hypothetical protein
MMAYGFIVGRGQVSNKTLYGFLSLALAIGIFLMGRRATKALDRAHADRLKYIKGGQGEEFVAWLLEDLPAGYHVFNGLVLTDGSDLA